MAHAAFYLMAAGSVASALLAVTRKNPVHSMLWVLALFLQVAAIFLLLQAEFLAAVQVIVYAGAILVFYLFVLMLLDLPDELARPRFSSHWPWAVAGGIGLVILSRLVQITPVRDTALPNSLAQSGAEMDGAPLGSLSSVGRALFGPFALPFEIASLILLAAIVGAVVLAKGSGQNDRTVK